MTLLHLSPVWWLLGLGALAGVLFLLQRLRVRHREVAVPTTLFWKEAIQEARARLLVKRFRHPLAYALMLLIGALLLTALAGPRTGEDNGVRHIVLVDASSVSMGDVDLVLETLTAYVAELPASQRSVVLCADHLRPVLAPGEDALLLARRLKGFVPADAPQSVTRALRQVVRGHTSAQPTHLHVVARRATSLPANERLPEGFTIHRVEPEQLDLSMVEPRITTLGIAEPASGAWGVVDILVQANTWAAEQAGSSESPLLLPTELPLRTSPALPVQAEREAADWASDSRLTTWRYADVPARGQEVTFIVGDTGAAGMTARLLLPDRRPIRVALDEALTDPFEAVLRADPAILLVTDNPQLAVRAAGSTVGGEVPALEIAPAGSQREALLLHHGVGVDPGAFLHAANKELGLGQLDGQRLADAAQRPIEVRTEERARRGLTLSGDLLAEPYDFVPSRDFPLFVARSVRWLAEVRSLRQRVAAGEPLDDAAGMWTSDIEGASPTSALSAPFTPPVAGRQESAEGDVLVAALLEKPTGPAPKIEERKAQSFSSGSNLATLFLLLAFALLGFEWWAYRTSRVP